MHPEITADYLASQGLSPTLINRFWPKVKKTETCWLWIASKTRTGYGQISSKGRPIRAHRVAWIITHGPIPDELCVLHKCDVRTCVNPDHLWLGTKIDNNADRDIKGRVHHARGENASRAKLTWEKVAQIRIIHATRQANIAQLASRFGVSSCAIHNVVFFKTWTKR